MSDADLPLLALHGGFELDRRAGELRKNGAKINLPGQLLRLLGLLMERPGEVITREEIRGKLWAGSFVNFDDSINSAIKRLRRTLEDSADNPRFIETLPGHGYRFAVHPERIGVGGPIATADGKEPLTRIAVLPFENLSGNSADEYIVDGLTEALTIDLAKNPSWQVRPRTSVMPFKGQGKSLQAIGKILKVDMELSGTVIRSGNRVRVTAQLLSIAGEEYLWAESYEAEFHDALTLQSEITHKIIAEVTRRLRPRQRYVPPAAHDRRRMAYESYLKAHRVFKNFTDEGLWKARQHWKRAVQEDPEYAKAHACLAETYNMLAIVGLAPVTDAIPQARLAAQTAVAIDDLLSEAHTGLACCYMLQWEWGKAAKEFDTAIRLDSNLNASNPCHYGEFLMATGQQERAILEFERLQEAQPLSAMLGVILGWLYYGTRSYDRAIRQHQRVLAIEPQFAMGHMCLGLAYSQRQRHSLAIEECRKSRLLGGSRQALSALGTAYAAAGDVASARHVLDELNGMGRNGFVPPSGYAPIYAALGEKNAALDYMTKGYDARDAALIGINWDPRYDSIRSESQFQLLLRNVGLKNIVLARGAAIPDDAPNDAPASLPS